VSALTLPAELARERTERLRPPQPSQETPPAPATPSRPPQGLALRLGKRAAHRVLGPKGVAWLRVHVLRPDALQEALRRSEEGLRRVGELEQQVVSMQHRAVELELTQTRVEAATVNLELLKGEVRSIAQALDDLGMAIAPATGLAGAGARLSELRERVNGLDRRLRTVMSAPPTPSDERPVTPQGGDADQGRATVPGTAPQSTLFDYAGFERRFRGDPEVVVAEMAARYLDLLVANPPVVDIGCGRAELLELLTSRGVEAVGVDTDPSLVAEARDRGLDARLVDGNAFLRDSRPGSIGAIIATHLVEHLELDDLVEFLDLAASRLRPGGVLIAETPNPAALIVLGNSYILDPTHVRPLHPSLLSFLCEGAGFRDVRLRFYAPASDYHLQPVRDPAAPAWIAQVNEAFAKLNSVLFGHQDYAVIATTAPAAEGTAEGEQ
jgi:SAM-dependent methyltransferase